MAIDPYTLNSIDEQIINNNKKIEATMEATGLSIADLGEQAGFIDRVATSFKQNMGMYQYPNQVKETLRAQESLENWYKSQGKDPEELMIRQASMVGSDLKQMKELEDNEEAILLARKSSSTSDNLLEYNSSLPNVKTASEIRQEMIDEQMKLMEIDRVQTDNSTMLGMVGYAVGAIGAATTDPTSFIPMAGATGLALKTTLPGFQAGGKAALKSGLQMMGYDLAINAAYTGVTDPYMQAQEQQLTGEAPTIERHLMAQAYSAAFTAPLSAIGSAGATLLSRSIRPQSMVKEVPIEETPIVQGSRTTNEAEAEPTPFDPLATGPITRDFVDRFEAAKPRMDPEEAAIIQTSVDIAKSTPRGLDQSQHAANVETSFKAFARGEEPEIPFTVKDDTAKPATVQPIDDLNSVDQQINEWVKDVPVDEKWQTDFQELNNRIESMTDDIELEDGTRFSKDAIRNKLESMTDDIDTADKLWACFSKGGPKVNG